MRPLSAFLRWHHAVIGLFIVAMPVICSLISGWGAFSTQLGWSLASGWTMAALIEIAAVAADRWRSSVIVARSTLVVSLAALSIALILKVSYIQSFVWGLRWWATQDPSSLYLVVLGTDFWLAAFAGLQMIAEWAGLLASFLLIRSSWQRRGTAFAGAFVQIMLALLSFVWSTSVVIAVGSAHAFFRDMGFDIFSMEWQVYYFTPTIFSAWPLLMALMLWTARAWIFRATGTQAMEIVLSAAGACLLPFIYGLLAFQSPVRQQDIMGAWYFLSIALLPLVLWIAAVVILRPRRTGGVVVR